MANVLDRFRLDGKVALVTGGARGLGRVISDALASAGARIALTSRDAAQAETMAASLRSSQGVESLALTVDVTGRRAWRRWWRGRSTGSAGSTSWSTTPGSISAVPSSNLPRQTGTR